MKSIIQSDKKCIICGTTQNLEKHHMIFGTGKRKLADADGLWCWLCSEHHKAVHNEDTYDKEMLQVMAQRAYEREHGHRAWMARYRRNYL